MTERTTTVHSTITAANRNQWNNLVKQSAHGTVFHRYEWLEAVEAGLDRSAYHAVVRTGTNPVAILPNFVTDLDLPRPNGVVGAAVDALPTDRLVSTHPGYGGPVLSSDPEQCLDALLAGVRDAADGEAIAHKIRTGTLGQTRYSKYLTGQGYEPTVVSCRFVLTLEVGWEAIKANMDRTRRNAIDGDHSGLTVSRRSFDGDTVQRTHQDYVRNMERVDGTTYPSSFFEALSAHVGDRIEVFVAERDGEVLGRYVCVVDDERSTLRYYFSAIPDESAYEYDTAERLHAAAIQWAMDEGYERYDLGTTGADFADGLFQYKEQYGADIHPIIQWDTGLSPVAWNAFKLGRRLYRETNY